MLRLRTPGVPQRHGGYDPVSVETRFCAGRNPWMVSDHGTERAMNPRCGATRPCAVNAVRGVACLEWRRRIGEYNRIPRPGERAIAP